MDKRFALANAVRSGRRVVPTVYNFTLDLPAAEFAARVDMSVDFLHRIGSGEVRDVPEVLLTDLSTVLFRDPTRLSALLAQEERQECHG